MHVGRGDIPQVARRHDRVTLSRIGVPSEGTTCISDATTRRPALRHTMLAETFCRARRSSLPRPAAWTARASVQNVRITLLPGAPQGSGVRWETCVT